WNALTAIGWGARADAATRWDVPVLCVPGADQQDGDIVVRGGGQRIAGVRGDAIDALAVPADGTSLPLRLALSKSARPWLTLATRRAHTEAARGAVCESSELTTCMEVDGTLSHALRVRLRNWQEPRFPIVIPAEVQGLAAKVDGIWVDRLETEP